MEARKLHSTMQTITPERRLSWAYRHINKRRKTSTTSTSASRARSNLPVSLRRIDIDGDDDDDDDDEIRLPPPLLLTSSGGDSPMTTPFDKMLCIQDGESLSQWQDAMHSQSDSVGQLNIRKCVRYRISDASENDQPRWRRLCQAVVLDFIQKGPDTPAPEGHGSKKRYADDRPLRRIIKNRYKEVFNKPNDTQHMTELQIEMVIAYLSILFTRFGNAASTSVPWVDVSLWKRVD